jgi:hypothetical protein
MQLAKSLMQTVLITGTVLSVFATYVFAFLTAAGRKPGLPLLPKWFLPPIDYIFFPSRLTIEGLHARKRCFIFASLAVAFVLCDALALWMYRI